MSPESWEKIGCGVFVLLFGNSGCVGISVASLLRRVVLGSVDSTGIGFQPTVSSVGDYDRNITPGKLRRCRKVRVSGLGRQIPSFR
jgi:hypothetical protein